MRRGEFVARLARLIADVSEGQSAEAAAATMRALAGELDNGASRGTVAGSVHVDVAASVRRVFEHWREATGKTRARLLPERAAKIRARLKQFSERELKAAVDGALLSEWHTGAKGGNEYLDIRTIFKNGEVVEGHVARAGLADDGMNGESVEDRRKTEREKAITRALNEALEAGDVERYNELNKALEAERRSKHE